MRTLTATLKVNGGGSDNSSGDGGGSDSSGGVSGGYYTNT